MSTPTGVHVQLRSFPQACVCVSDAEIDAALARSGAPRYRSRERVAANIALGKRCGSFEHEVVYQQVTTEQGG